MPTQIGLDLFARQNVRLYCIQAAKGVKYIPMETDSLELVFEFTGINEDFSLSSQNLVLNTVVLVNAQQQTITLSSANPIARVAGYDIHTAENTIYGRQFLHMLRPSEDQIYGETPVEVRRMSADRFNQGALVKLLNNLINKFNSDYYAFLDIQEVANDKLINVLIDILSRLQAAAKQDSARSISGVYLMLRPSAELQNQPISMEVTYLTTAGASINNLLSDDMMFTAPSGFESGGTRLIAAPTPGFDELHDEKAKASLRRYYMTTHDRLVTPADIKLFCYHELLSRYGIVRDMVKSISVYHRQEYEKRLSGYEILVEIVLIENTFVKRGFADKIQQTEILLKAMMNVRSTNIYPIQVIIRLEPE